MRTNASFGAAQPTALNVQDVTKPGQGCLSDLITNTSTVNGTWGAITALAAAVIATLVTTTVKSLNGTPVGIQASAAVVGVSYTIQSLGTTTQAQFLTLFGTPPGGASGVWAVGMTGQAIGAGAGTALLTTDEQTYTAVPLPAGATIYGEFKQITLTSGTVLAYRY